MYSWELRNEPTDGNDDFTIVVSDEGGNEVMWIGVGEAIGDCTPRFVFQTTLECVQQGVWKPDADGIMLAGEIPCWAQSMAQKQAQQQARKRKAQA